MARRAQADKTRGRGLILVFGESSNDTAAIRHLVEGLRPELSGRVKALRSPPVLLKNARVSEIPKRTKRLVDVARAKSAVSPVAALVLHEDADAMEPAHIEIADRIEEQVSAVCGRSWKVVAAVPAWELEAWLLLWPDCAAKARRSWQAPKGNPGRDTGRIPNAKEHLAKALVSHLAPHDARRARYSESDSQEIARIVKEDGVAPTPDGSSASFRRFSDAVGNL